MKFIVQAIYLFALLGCDGPHSIDRQQNNPISKVAADSVPECVPRDTVTPSGIEIHYLYDNESYQISWGNAGFRRTYDSVYTCTRDTYGGIWDFIPKLESETPNRLIFKNVLSTSGGANPAPIEFTAILLPKNATDPALEVPFYIDCLGNYLLYAEPYTTETLYLMNVETKKIQEIILDPPAAVGRTIAFALQHIRIKNGQLRFEYEALREDHEVYNKRMEVTIRV